MEVLARYDTKEHQERRLKPLLAGENPLMFCNDQTGGGIK